MDSILNIAYNTFSENDVIYDLIGDVILFTSFYIHLLCTSTHEPGAYFLGCTVISYCMIWQTGASTRGQIYITHVYKFRMKHLTIPGLITSNETFRVLRCGCMASLPSESMHVCVVNIPLIRFITGSFNFLPEMKKSLMILSIALYIMFSHYMTAITRVFNMISVLNFSKNELYI